MELEMATPKAGYGWGGHESGLKHSGLSVGDRAVTVHHPLWTSARPSHQQPLEAWGGDRVDRWTPQGRVDPRTSWEKPRAEISSWEDKDGEPAQVGWEWWTARPQERGGQARRAVGVSLTPHSWGSQPGFPSTGTRPALPSPAPQRG